LLSYASSLNGVKLSRPDALLGADNQDVQKYLPWRLKRAKLNNERTLFETELGREARFKKLKVTTAEKIVCMGMSMDA
jgi:predicted sulfurtransferase